MVNLKSKRCGQQGCTTQPSYGVDGGKPEVCSEHKKGGMVDLKNKRCRRQGCTKQPSYGVYGIIDGAKSEFCNEHKKDGILNLRSKKCEQQGCTKQPSYGVGGSKKRQFCSAHKKYGMVGAVSARCCQQAPSRITGGNKRAHRAPTNLAVTPIPVEVLPNERTIPSQDDERIPGLDGVKIEPGAFCTGRRGSWR